MKRRAAWLVCAVLACSSGDPRAGSERDADPSEESGSPAPSPTPEEPPISATPLSREGHDVRITEVWLDEQASAALSLDGFGQVRLWPTLAEREDLQALAPIRLPIHEPGSLSFARARWGFVIAAIDTARTGRVIEVLVDEAGKALMAERFTIAPTDPLLELHVLAGGERLLALGVDHRIRLYDLQGKSLAELGEHGFIPWQLRVQSNRILAVLGSPTRVQTIELRDDRLIRTGELRTTLLDRGANLNDLQLTPDGRRVAVFRRQSSKSRRWSLQLLDLDDGEVRVFAGKVDGEIRPRLHLVDDRRALIEDGTGVGYWIDLEQGANRPAGFVLPEDFDDLPAEASVEPRRVALTHSKARERWHASVVAGIRAVPGDRQLVLDPVDDPEHRELGHVGFRVAETALSADGSLVAWWVVKRDGDPIVVDDLDQPGLSFEVPEFRDEDIETLAFIDDEHLLAASDDDAVIVAWRTGQRSSELSGPFAQVGVRERSPGVLEYSLRSGENDLTNIVDRRLVAGDPGEASQWMWADTDAAITDRNPRGQEFDLDSPWSVFSSLTVYADGRRSPELRLNHVDAMAPSPCGRWLAIVQDHTPRIYGGHAIGPSDISLTVYAIEDLDKGPRRIWSMPIAGGSSIDLAWSADGERLAIAEHRVGGLVVTAQGDVVFERRYAELSDAHAPDEPPAKD